MRGRLFLGLAAVLALPFLLSGAANGRAGAEGDVFPSGKVDPNVLDALKTKPWVEVFVALAEPPAAAAAAPLDLSALRQQVATGQSDVLLGLTGADFRLVDRYEAIPSLFGTVSAAGVAKLAADPGVARVYLPVELHYTLGQSVPLINADDVHTAGFTGAGVVVAPLDSGIDTDHADLQDDLIGEHCFADSLFVCPGGGSEAHGPGAAEDNNGHGTHVSGIVSSGGVVAPLGVAPDAELIMFKIGDQVSISASGALNALDYIITHPEDGVRVINMSWGGFSLLSPPCDPLFLSFAFALGTLRAAGVIAFAASGNDNDKDRLLFPACLSDAVSVGATYDANLGPLTWCQNWPLCTQTCTDAPTAADKVICFSNSHSQLDLLAPGSVITSAGLNNTSANKSGTSMAAPHAAGVAALMLEANPAATPDEIEACMKSGGVPVTDPANRVTTPRVDAVGAVDCIGGGPICPEGIGNGMGIPGDDDTDPNFILGDCDNDGLSDADELTGAACGGTVTDPGPDITYDDSDDGNPSAGSVGGTDASDDPAAWDTDGDGVRDGFECNNGFDPTDPTSSPDVFQCGGTGDSDGDGLLDAWENCKWGTDPAVIDSDGDTVGDCVEAADVDGNGVVEFGLDTIASAKAALLPMPVFGSDGDFDIDGNNIVEFGLDTLDVARFALLPGRCK